MGKSVYPELKMHRRFSVAVANNYQILNWCYWEKYRLVFLPSLGDFWSHTCSWSIPSLVLCILLNDILFTILCYSLSLNSWLMALQLIPEWSTSDTHTFSRRHTLPLVLGSIKLLFTAVHGATSKCEIIIILLLLIIIILIINSNNYKKREGDIPKAAQWTLTHRMRLNQESRVSPGLTSVWQHSRIWGTQFSLLCTHTPVPQKVLWDLILGFKYVVLVYR